MAALPMNLPAIAAGTPGGAPPSAGPVPMPPGAMPPHPPMPPAAPPPNPMGGGNSMGMLLALLAGAGIGPLIQSITKLQKPPGTGPTRTHQGGIRTEASNNPGMTIAPALAQILAKTQGNAGGLPIQ